MPPSHDRHCSYSTTGARSRAARLASLFALILTFALRMGIARAEPVLAFVIQSSRGTGTGFLVRDPGDYRGLFLITALHVVAGVSCALATPFPACPEDPLGAPMSGPPVKKFASCDVVPQGARKLSQQPTLIWAGHDLVAIQLDESAVVPGFAAGHIGDSEDLPQTARELFLQGAGASDACPNGGGRLRYYVRAGRFANWAAMRSKGQYKVSDFIGTVKAGGQLLVMSSTGSPGASGGPVTQAFDSSDVYAMYQGGDGRGQSTWAVVLTTASLRAETPLSRQFGDWKAVLVGDPALAQVDTDLTNMEQEVKGAVSRPAPPFSVDLPELVLEGNPGSTTPMYEVGAQVGAGAHVPFFAGLELELHGALQYARRWNRIRFDGPGDTSSDAPVEAAWGHGGSLGAELGLRIRVSRNRRFPCVSGDLLVRGRLIDESRARDERWSAAWGPLARVRLCGAFSWSWGLCVGPGVAYEYYQPTRYVYDGFGNSQPASWQWALRGQIVAGIEYAP